MKKFQGREKWWCESTFTYCSKKGIWAEKQHQVMPSVWISKLKAERSPGHGELQGRCAHGPTEHILRGGKAFPSSSWWSESSVFQMRCKIEPWPFIVIKDPMTILARVKMLTNMSWPISNSDNCILLRNSPCSFNWISFSSFLFPKPLPRNVSSPEWLLDSTPEVRELSVLGNPKIHFVYISQRKCSVSWSNTLTSHWGVFNFSNEKSHWW